jgi:aminoglycoside 2''-phosphotransferase
MEIKQHYLDQIKAAMPELIINDLQFNSDGLANEVIIVNRQRIFRFPKNDWAKTALQHEIKILDLTRNYVDVRLPLFDIRQEEMVSYELIPGEALLQWDILRQDQATQDRLAETIAQFLFQLHTVPQAELDKVDIPPSDTNRSPEDWLKLYEDVQQMVFPLMMSDAKVWTRRLFAPLVQDHSFMDYQPVLMNGDLGPYHILCDWPAGQITGIIDFGTAGRGDPAADFACIINGYGESFLRRMAKYYPEIKEHIKRARFWAGTLELQWVLGGIRTQDFSWFPVHIGRARDMMPVHSGWPS